MTVFVSSPQIPVVLVYQDDPVERVEAYLTAWMEGLDDPDDKKWNPWESRPSVLHCFDDELIGRAKAIAGTTWTRLCPGRPRVRRVPGRVDSRPVRKGGEVPPWVRQQATQRHMVFLPPSTPSPPLCRMVIFTMHGSDQRVCSSSEKNAGWGEAICLWVAV